MTREAVLSLLGARVDQAWQEAEAVLLDHDASPQEVADERDRFYDDALRERSKLMKWMASCVAGSVGRLLH